MIGKELQDVIDRLDTYRAQGRIATYGQIQEDLRVLIALDRARDDLNKTLAAKESNKPSFKEKLEELNLLTECTYSLGFNRHKGDYQSVRQFWFDPRDPGIPPDVVQAGLFDVDKDVWDIRIYPKTPIGFYHGISNSFELLIDWAIEAIKKENR
jgi:hypothetical protein